MRDEGLPVSAFSAARAGIAMWRIWVRSIPGAWMDERDGAAAVVTGLESVDHNGVWVTRPRPRAEMVAELLEDVAATGLPHCLQLRGGTSSAVIDVARGHGMTLDVEEPLMILRSPARARRTARPEGLSIRRVDADEGPLVASLTVRVFGGSMDLASAAANPRVLANRAVRSYVGEVRGKPVATATGVTLLGTTAIFDVATLPRYRRRGFGSALTAHAVLEGFGTGGRWAWLEASEGAIGVYEKLGFRAVETGSIWIKE